MRNVAVIKLLRTILCAGLLAGTAGAVSAAQVQGILITRMCAMKAAKGGPDAAAKHERTCNLKENCAKTGFGVLTSDNKFLSFDDAGNAKALQALQESTKKDDMQVTITGEVQGDTIKVATLKLAE